MNSRAFSDYDDKKRDNWDSLKCEFDSIQRDIKTIKGMEVPEESKKPILDELQKQANEIKERMHDYIDTL